MKYPEFRDTRNRLQYLIIKKYKDKPLGEITFSTEIILKALKPKDGSPERPLLKYKVINLDWDTTKSQKDVNFNSKMFRWMKAEEHDYGYTGAGDY